MRSFSLDDTTVLIVATLMGCEPASGLVNTMNSCRHLWTEGTTYGKMYRDVLEHMLAEHIRITGIYR